MSEHIVNIEKYCNDMSKSMEEKLFFTSVIDFAPLEGILDFGCADGTLLKECYKKYPFYKHIGIDSNPQMLKICDQNGLHDIYSSFDEFLICNPRLDLSKYVLVLSSVIHEIFSYMNLSQIQRLFKQFF